MVSESGKLVGKPRPFSSIANWNYRYRLLATRSQEGSFPSFFSQRWCPQQQRSRTLSKSWFHVTVKINCHTVNSQNGWTLHIYIKIIELKKVTKWHSNTFKYNQNFQYQNRSNKREFVSLKRKKLFGSTQRRKQVNKLREAKRVYIQCEAAL